MNGMECAAEKGKEATIDLTGDSAMGIEIKLSAVASQGYVRYLIYFNGRLETAIECATAEACGVELMEVQIPSIMSYHRRG